MRPRLPHRECTNAVSAGCAGTACLRPQLLPCRRKPHLSSEFLIDALCYSAHHPKGAQTKHGIIDRLLKIYLTA